MIEKWLFCATGSTARPIRSWPPSMIICQPVCSGRAASSFYWKSNVSPAMVETPRRAGSTYGRCRRCSPVASPVLPLFEAMWRAAYCCGAFATIRCHRGRSVTSVLSSRLRRLNCNCCKTGLPMGLSHRHHLQDYWTMRVCSSMRRTVAGGRSRSRDGRGYQQ